MLVPIYEQIDGSTRVRRFAERWIYRRPEHADYFARALLLLVSTVIAFGVVTWWQVSHGSLPIWLIFLYYLAWVGFGGRTMGAACTFAHREGHRPGGGLYRPWIRNIFRNVVENWSDLMLYFHRIFVYMTGWSSLRAFKTQERGERMDRAYRQLRKGFVLYWVAAPAVIIAGLIAAGSTLPSALAFVFFIYLQPLCAMSIFIALLNVSFHGFLELEEIALLLEQRAKRVEMSYEYYEFEYLPRICETTEDLVRRGTCANLSQAYRCQAHHNLQGATRANHDKQ